MHIDKYKNAEGAWEKDGVDYHFADLFIQNGLLGFCGCGCPDGNLEHIRDGLQHIEDWVHNAPDGGLTKHLETWAARKTEIFGNEWSANFFYYWADKQGYSAHGGSIPGWLTSEGAELLEDLNEILKEQE